MVEIRAVRRFRASKPPIDTQYPKLAIKKTASQISGGGQTRSSRPRRIAGANPPYSFLAPEGETLSFASPKESIQRKGDTVAAYFLRSSLSPGVDERGSCPFVNVRHPCRTPAG